MRLALAMITLALLAAPASADRLETVAMLTDDTPQWSLVENATDHGRSIARDPATAADDQVNDLFDLHPHNLDYVAEHACWTGAYASPDDMDAYQLAAPCHGYYMPGSETGAPPTSDEAIDAADHDSSFSRDFGARLLRTVGGLVGGDVEYFADYLASLIEP